ncbi:MAG: NlpC/P60 family protein [Acidaminococcaceae bacterium]|nr:NlpC/P60 family protein [Acidaminococcaceae bacterium]
MHKIFLLACACFLSVQTALAGPALLPNTTPAMEKAEFWYTDEGEKIVADKTRIAAINKSMLSTTMCDLAAYPASISKNQLQDYLAHYQLDSELYINGKLISADYAQRIKNDGLGTIAPSNAVKYGVVIGRSNLRSFPTLTRAFTTPEDQNFDMWQETAVDPGEPAIILHYNKKGNFVFVQLASYRGWLPTNQVAVSNKATWLTYVEPKEFAVVTGKTLLLRQELYQMGAKLPLVKDKLLVPTRNKFGYLEPVAMTAAFNADLHKGYLPFTRNNLVNMAFKHLGAPYGWGGLDSSVDCSAFVQDIYKTVGVQLPRNGDEQAAAFSGINLENLTSEEKIEIIKALPPGSLLFTPYHVMLYLGERDGRPYMIHAAGSYGAQDASGNIYKNSIMQVVVSDIYLLGSSGNSLLSQMTKAINYH